LVFRRKQLTATRKGIKLRYSHPVRRIDFDEEEKEWLDNNDTEPDYRKFKGSGYFGDVYSLKKNSDFVMKVPREMPDYDQDFNVIGVKCSREGIEREAKSHSRNNMSKLELFTPSKTVSIPKRSLSICKSCEKKSCIGLVRPVIEPIENDHGFSWSDEDLKDLRKQLKTLSSKGIYFNDDLQVGKNKKGVKIIYDADLVRKTKDTKKAFDTNELVWKSFLTDKLMLGKEYAKRFGRLED